MQVSMTLANIAVLFGSMIALAAAPSVSVLTVSARSASLGFRHGVFTTLGILAADILFILLALFGLTLLAKLMGNTFYVIGYIGGAYLILLGVGLWVADRETPRREPAGAASLLSSFWAGLLITLADQKAVLFYLGFFPAFVDLSQIGAADFAIILALTVFAVGGVKLVYAYLAERAGIIFGATAGRALNRTAAAIMIIVGLYLVCITHVGR